jgi:hypothetical protein
MMRPKIAPEVTRFEPDLRPYVCFIPLTILRLSFFSVKENITPDRAPFDEGQVRLAAPQHLRFRQAWAGWLRKIFRRFAFEQTGFALGQVSRFRRE